jgi:hypothetical protein
MIKNKDGTPYSLSKPNKLSVGQVRWDLAKMIFHNWQWNEILLDNIINVAEVIEEPQPEPVVKSVPQAIEIVDKSEELVPPLPVHPKPAVPMPEAAIEPEKRQPEIPELPELKNVVLFHCLPVQQRTHDSMYGEEVGPITYGEKFIFPGVLLANIDLKMQFWTTDPNSQITTQSIIYPFRYKDGPPLNEFRWWLVTGKTNKSVGYVFDAVPSKYQPDFSD